MRLNAFYLIFLALIPWSKIPPFPWLHENAQWSDPVFAVAAGLWLLDYMRRRTWPRFGTPHLAMAIYLLAATLSLILVAPDRAAGYFKLLGMAELVLIALMTSDLSDNAAMTRRLVWTVAATSVAVAVTSIGGIVLFYFDVPTPLVGTYGDHFVQSRGFTRAQGPFSHPNLLGSYCVFAAAICSNEKSILPARLRAGVQILLWITVLLTLSHSILGFILAAAIRWARSSRTRWCAAALGALFAMWIVSLTFLNWSVDLARPLASHLRWEAASGREQTVRSALRTLADHPLWGCGPGASPGWFRGRPYDSHLTPLNVAATLGLPALGAFVWMFVALWRGRGRPTEVGIWSAFAGFGLDSLVSDIEDFRHLWVMIGLVGAGAVNEKHREVSSHRSLESEPSVGKTR